MEENKKKKIEDRLRQMCILEKQMNDKDQVAKDKTIGAKVIRRRKGAPDRRIV